MKTAAILSLIAAVLLAACPVAGFSVADSGTETVIVLSDDTITVDGASISNDASSAVYAGAAIIYYESGTDSSYGAGSSSDMHTAQEAAKHTVVTITQAGTYRISGTLSYGQIAVDVGSDESDVVTLILDGVDITCTVAPAIIFYNVWESGNSSTATTTIPDEAGANVIIADGSVNNVTGSHVAKIYKEGTTSKLYKFDGAFYSEMSMIISGGSKDTGILNIVGDNEGLDSELHLTINGGIINIRAQDDGINTNEDGISVTEINGGTLYVNAGLGSEGDGIDSNGYLIINGGTIVTMANPQTGDGGIDADMDILINGGTLAAFGSRNDAVSSSSAQAYMELVYSSSQAAGTIACIKDSNGNTLVTVSPLKGYQYFTFSSSDLQTGSTYYVYSGGTCTGTLSSCLYTGGTYSGGTQMQYTGTSAEGPGGGQPGQPGQPGSSGSSGQSSGSIYFTLSTGGMTFTGVSASSQSSSSTVTITVTGLSSSMTSGSAAITAITVTLNGTVLSLDGHIQITITDYPSESYYQTAILSEGLAAVNALMPTDEGTYLITVALTSGSGYSGTYQYTFAITAASADTEDSGSENGTDNVLLYAAAAVIAIILIAAFAYYFFVAKKKP